MTQKRKSRIRKNVSSNKSLSHQWGKGWIRLENDKKFNLDAKSHRRWLPEVLRGLWRPNLGLARVLHLIRNVFQGQGGEDYTQATYLSFLDYSINIGTTIWQFWGKIISLFHRIYQINFRWIRFKCKKIKT